MITKLREIIQRQDDLTERMSEPETAADPKRYAQLAREHSELAEVADKARRFVDLDGHRHELEDMLTGDDEELKELAAEELPTLNAQLAEMEEELKVLLLPRDPADDKNTVLEIRSGTGGEDGARFA